MLQIFSVTVIAEEPVKGWGTNFYGINGTVVAGATGLMRVASVNKGAIAHLVCTDQVVNATLTVLWDIGSKNLYVHPNAYVYSFIDFL